MVNPCQRHPTKQISNVCMSCKVGLCSKCVSSAAVDEHREHNVMGIDNAFEALKNTCESLAGKGLETSKLIQEQSSKIRHFSRSLLTAHQTKNLVVFELIDDLKTILNRDSTASGIQQGTTVRSSSAVTEVMSDGKYDCISVSTSPNEAFGALQSGMIELQNFCTSNKHGSVLYTKLAAVSMLTDVLRIKLYHNKSDGLEQNLSYLTFMITASEPCCRRLIMLGGVDLLISCFEHFKSDSTIVYDILYLLGNLLVSYACHHSMATSQMVNMLTYIIQNFEMTQHQLPSWSCRILSHILSRRTVEWPQDCLSREDTSILVMNTCKQFRINEPLITDYISFRPEVLLLSQQVSEAAKYWPVWQLNRHTLLHPNEYCPMLVRDRGVAVLKQQDHAHDYVKDKAKLILQRIEGLRLD